eukprot:TRINITY_DN5591_c0_g1_i1.p1 TRINITY_DN5591_c0_g1~~TRINITY_DN5591_c0_g1_i1.p1  ORF type:complete len:500 (-),score=106.54 TRINITY_DN5591_c0_g1_i1:37-1458(-)
MDSFHFPILPPPSSNDWKDAVTNDQRDQLIEKVVSGSSLTHIPLQNLRSLISKIEDNLYQQCTTKFNYFSLMAQIVLIIKNKQGSPSIAELEEEINKNIQEASLEIKQISVMQEFAKSIVASPPTTKTTLISKPPTQLDNDALLAATLQAQFDAEQIKTPVVTHPPPPPHPIPLPIPHFTDPVTYSNRGDRFNTPPTAGCIKRIRSDLEAMIKHPNPFIHVAPHEEDITHIEALIIGPEGTPYQHGLFHFDMKFPHDYPWNPPKVLLMTTDSGRTRFNPNLYADGKVCLSILGTWQGPGWKAVQTIESVLVSVQSLMNSHPYHNERGYENERRSGDSKNYNECIIHETLRVAVCGMMEAPTCGDVFKSVMDEVFVKHYNFYIKTATEKQTLDGTAMKDPFGGMYGNYNYGTILTRLQAIKAKLNKEYASACSSTHAEAPKKKKTKEKIKFKNFFFFSFLFFKSLKNLFFFLGF